MITIEKAVFAAAGQSPAGNQQVHVRQRMQDILHRIDDAEAENPCRVSIVPHATADK